MKRLMGWITALLLCLSTGCIRKEVPDCPPMRIQLTVADKNYTNIDQVAALTGLDERANENLPFRSYVDQVYYALYRVGETEPLKVEHLYEVTGEEATHELLFPQELPFGDYALVVWANIDGEQGIEFDGRPDTYHLHSEHQEGYDVYLGSDTLHYDLQHPHFTVPLRRVKGKLLILAEGLPSSVSLTHKEVNRLYDKVDAQWHYSGTESVHTIHRWDGTQREMFTDTYLSPTQDNAYSEVKVHFVQSDSTLLPDLQPAAINIHMERNEITVLRYVYDDTKGDFNIYVLIDDGWLLIHDMDLEE